MRLTPSKVNWFLMFKLPAAFLCGVRLKSLTDQQCVVSVKYRWINQNPFRSMYFAVQMMAAELSTGALVMSHVRQSGRNISMLVASNQAVFHKRITGRATFTCADGGALCETLANVLASGEGQTVSLRSIARDEAGDIVSEMRFEWTLKLR